MLVTLLLVVLFSGVIGAVLALPTPPSPLAALDDPDCPAPCWSGIQPGQTRLDDVDVLLSTNHWVTDFGFNRGMALDTGIVIWRWTETAPAWIDTRTAGEMWVEDGIVQWIKLPVRLRFGDVWAARAAPAQGITQRIGQEARLMHFGLYPADALFVRGVLACPPRRTALWWMPVTFYLGNAPIGIPAAYALPDVGDCMR
jgi:hypothetical protein